MSTCNRHKARGENLPLCFYESEEHSASAKRRQCQSRCTSRCTSRIASRSTTVRETMGHLPTSWQYQVPNFQSPNCSTLQAPLLGLMGHNKRVDVQTCGATIVLEWVQTWTDGVQTAKHPDPVTSVQCQPLRGFLSVFISIHLTY